MIPFVVKTDKLILDYSEKNVKGFLSCEKDPVLWKCHICGCEWVDRINRRRRGAGCPSCNVNTIRHLKMRKNDSTYITDPEKY